MKNNLDLSNMGLIQMNQIENENVIGGSLTGAIEWAFKTVFTAAIDAGKGFVAGVQKGYNYVNSISES